MIFFIFYLDTIRMKKINRKFVNAYNPRYKLVDEDTGKEISFETSFRKAKVGKALYGYLRRSKWAQNYISKGAREQAKMYRQMATDKNKSKEERRMAKNNADKYTLIDKISIRFRDIIDVLKSHYINNPVLPKLMENEPKLMSDISNMVEKGITKDSLYNYLFPLIRSYIMITVSDSYSDEDLLNFLKVTVILKVFNIPNELAEKIKLSESPEVGTSLLAKEIIDNNPEIITPLHSVKYTEEDIKKESFAAIQKAYNNIKDKYSDYLVDILPTENDLSKLIEEYYKTGSFKLILFVNILSKGSKSLIYRKLSGENPKNKLTTSLFLLMLSFMDQSIYFDSVLKYVEQMSRYYEPKQFEKQAFNLMDEANQLFIQNLKTNTQFKFH